MHFCYLNERNSDLKTTIRKMKMCVVINYVEKVDKILILKFLFMFYHGTHGTVYY